jgi:type III pantothenate kinase
MRPHIVADIGNSRIKWGLCAPDGPRILATAALPIEPRAWEQQLGAWRAQMPLAAVTGPLTWVLASVQPQSSERLRAWLAERGERVEVLSFARQLPLEVAVPVPDHVGIDRLLDAVAAKAVLPAGIGAVLIDAGSAVTVDWLDETHTFRGGAIFPGIRLMAEALHQYTALLPLVTVGHPVPALPGTATPAAMQVGIFLAVAGGIGEVVRRYEQLATRAPRVFLSGGDAGLLMQELAAGHWASAIHWPNQTLEGILYSVEGLP